MSKHLQTSNSESPLNNIQVASPCSVDWDTMMGDERTRMCAQCNKHVYDLSSLNKKDAEKLVMKTEGKICVTFFRRHDGTVITDDCPVGLRAIRATYRRISSSAAAFLALFLWGAGAKANEVGPPPGRLTGELMQVQTETPQKPWMKAYKTSAVKAITKKIAKEVKLDDPEFLVTIDKTGRVVAVSATKCSADQLGSLSNIIQATALPAFPKEASETQVNLRLILKRTK